MTMPTFDFTALTDTYRETLAPVFAAQQTGLRTLERVARYQFAVYNDYLDWALSYAKASVQPKPVADLVTEQTELNTAFGDKLRARAEELSQIATETRGNVTQWFGDTSAKVAESMKKAA
ncbi:MAG TPA: phasin family protein [Steroidobacteraceae bacterium]